MAKYLLHKVNDAVVIDHINRDALDNTIANLRVASCSQNAMNRAITIRNTSGYKGVSWDKLTKKWHARIERNRRSYHLGFYENILDAAAAYNKAAIELHQQFAILNET